MSIKNPYSTRVPLVALESIHTQRPYSLIPNAMRFSLGQNNGSEKIIVK